jgi:hypothetical protein
LRPIFAAGVSLIPYRSVIGESHLGHLMA